MKPLLLLALALTSGCGSPPKVTEAVSRNREEYRRCAQLASARLNGMIQGFAYFPENDLTANKTVLKILREIQSDVYLDCPADVQMHAKGEVIKAPVVDGVVRPPKQTKLEPCFTPCTLDNEPHPAERGTGGEGGVMTTGWKYRFIRYAGWFPVQSCCVCWRWYWGGFPMRSWQACMKEYCSKKCYTDAGEGLY